jgi:hypothetical protein
VFSCMQKRKDRNGRAPKMCSYGVRSDKAVRLDVAAISVTIFRSIGRSISTAHLPTRVHFQKSQTLETQVKSLISIQRMKDVALVRPQVREHPGSNVGGPHHTKDRRQYA